MKDRVQTRLPDVPEPDMLPTHAMSAARALTYVLWVVPAILQVGIAAKMYGTRLMREFPFFFAYTVFHIVHFVVLFTTFLVSRPPYTAYFFEYWSAEAIDVALGVAITYEIYAHVFQEYAALKRLGNVLFQWCAALLVLVGVLMAAMSPGSQPDRLIAGIFAAEHCFSILRAGLLLFLFVFARAFGLTWRHYVFGIALGFAVYVSFELGMVAMRAHIGNAAAVAYSLLKQAAYNCAAGIWVIYFLRPEPRAADVKVMPKTDMVQWNEALLQILHR